MYFFLVIIPPDEAMTAGVYCIIPSISRLLVDSQALTTFCNIVHVPCHPRVVDRHIPLFSVTRHSSIPTRKRWWRSDPLNLVSSLSGISKSLLFKFNLRGLSTPDGPILPPHPLFPRGLIISSTHHVCSVLLFYYLVRKYILVAEPIVVKQRRHWCKQFILVHSYTLVQEIGRIYLCWTAKRLDGSFFSRNVCWIQKSISYKILLGGFPQNQFKVGYPQIINLNFRRCANLIDVTLFCDNYTNFKSVAMDEVLK